MAVAETSSSSGPHLEDENANNDHDDEEEEQQGDADANDLPGLKAKVKTKILVKNILTKECQKILTWK